MGAADLDLAADLLIALGEIELARACAVEGRAPGDDSAGQAPPPPLQAWRPLEDR